MKTSQIAAILVPVATVNAEWWGGPLSLVHVLSLEQPHLVARAHVPVRRRQDGRGKLRAVGLHGHPHRLVVVLVAVQQPVQQAAGAALAAFVGVALAL
ncbi:hypothetical protein MAPG_02291 [Magnaporthiopsis poae ATCC 64411]|uniref:Secreted protein n=1 Tax=Magnaporthiopsis poae (strain ATCC 64411 / 73-15) TaxID=644358 RepID=A0A0C4DQZ2_MAGP6|nr:hypothetical protein MAPG_02291 [Magnaporthiopsis poae ATCC 64411]